MTTALKYTDAEIDLAFTQYLENALVEFESPHNMTDAERLDVYRQAFHKTLRGLKL